MKKLLITFAAMVALALLATTGCSNNKIDTAKVRAAMQSLGQQDKAQLEVALTAIDAGKYKDALLPLRKIVIGTKLDKTQNKIIKDTIEKVQIHIAKEQ